MLRQLRARCCHPAPSLITKLFKSPQPQQCFSWQRHFASQSGATRRGPRSHHGPGGDHSSRNHHYHHHQHDGKSPRRLHAGIYGMILVPIEYMVLDETLDMEARRHKALITINAIEEEKNVAARWRKFYETGEAVLAAFSGAEVESHEGAVRVPAGSSWAVNADRVRVLTTPDPDVEGGTFLVCLVLMGKTKDVYIATHVDSNPTTDIALDMIPGVEAFARSLPESPKVRGAMVVLQDPIGDFKSLYWDGKRWINIVFI